MNRAYAVLEIKAMDEEKRTFKGIATTPTADRSGDIVEPEGATFSLPLPLLWQHNSSDPIGWVKKATVTKDGIEVEGEIAEIAEDGELKSRLNKAWQMIKSQLVRGLSIGFNPIEYNRIEGTYSYRFVKWEWLELSAVTIPANQESNITSIKRFASKSAFGKQPVRLLKTPGDSGKQSKSIKLVRSTGK